MRRPTAPFLVLVGVVCAGRVAAQDALFDQPLIATTAAPVDVERLDLDGDGRDEIVASEGAAGVQLFRSTAGGFWLPATSLAVPLPAGRTATGDLNGDGRDDLVLTGNASGKLSVLLADGLGDLLAPATQTLPGPANDVALGDLDLDGALDAVVMDQASSLLRVLFGTGAGALNFDGAHATKPQPEAVALGDTNGDGALDALTAHGPAKIIGRLAGDGLGGLGNLRSYSSGGWFSALACGDVDGDGRDDVLATGFDPDAVAVLRGLVSGLGAPQLTPLPDYGVGLAAGDLDGDGLCDAVIGSGDPQERIFVAHSQGAGPLGAPSVHVAAAASPGLVLGDVNGDGALDAIGTSYWKLLTVLHGDGAGDLRDPPAVSLGGSCRDICSIDLDGDGLSDFVGATYTTHGIVAVRSDGAGGLEPPVTTPLPLQADDVQAGDVDLDGDADVVALIGYTGSQLTFGTILLRNVAGSLQAEPLTQLVSLQYANQVALADLDDDGALDIVGSYGSFLQGGGLLNARGNGAGGWLLPAKVQDTGSFAQVDVAVADIDSDGDLDAASLSLDTWSLLSYGLGIWANDGAGHLVQKPGAFVSGTGSEIPPWGIALGDLDGDGDTDAIAHTDKTYVLKNSGGLALAGAGSLATPSKPARAAIADLDADGRADVIVGSEDTNALTLFRGTASGFAPPESCVAGDKVGELALGDADGDGFTDVATVSMILGKLVLHVNGLTSALSAVTPSAGDLVGGQLVTLSLQPAAVELPAPQVSFGGVPAQVLASGPGFVQVLAPGVAEPPGAAVDVAVSGAFGSLQRAAAWTWTPSLTADVSGSAASGGSLHVAWQGDPAAGAQLVTLWLGHPLVPQVSLTFGAWAGILRVPPFLFLLTGAPAGLSPLDLGFPPLDAAIVGVPLSLQAALTGEGGAKGAFSNLAVFEIP